MLEMLGLLYTLDTDKYSYSPREVDRDWLDASGFHARAADAGLELTWAPVARVATLEYEKWLVVHEEDNKTHTKRKLQRRDTILMARKAAEPAG